uniref:U3 small nucleolar ribonucleoprotein protein MPP10 n=1 Tax=Panagrolaimus sp. JU765 TaxID=591449 RepID=A0AC34PY05_9BILA
MNDSQFDLEPMEIDTSLNTSNRRRISSIVGEQSSESDADDEITSSNKEQEDSSSDVPVVQNVNEKDSGSGTNGVVSTPITNVRKRKSLENKSVELTEVSDAKTLLKQRGTKEEVMLKTIAQFYSDSNKLELFETGLPDDLVIKDDIETIWQQLAIQNASFLKGVKKSNKLLDEDLDFESKTEKQVVDEPLFSDDSENELIEDENDEEEEEEDADLFNLKDEDLMNLDAQLKKLDESDDEELPKKKKKLEKSDEGQRKGKKSAADDKFFSLEEMERHQDIDDVAITDESDDESDTAADYQYKDFFGGNDSTDTKTDTKKKVKFAEESDDEDEDDDESGDSDNEPVLFGEKPKEKSDFNIICSDTKKKVKFAKESDDEEEDDDESGDSDNEPVLFGEKPKEKVLSTHEIVRNKLEAAIEKIQQENLNPRSWELSGEVTAEARERESLLEKYIEVDFRQRQPPINGQEKAQKIQSVCLRRLKDKLFDDVERKYREDDTVQPYRNLTIDMNERKTLMEVYEDRFKAAQMGDADTDDMDPMIKDVQEKMTKLFAKLDALTHLQYAPGRVTEEIQIVKNMPSMRAEEVGPMATTAPDESVLAPEEIARHIKAAPIAKDERTKTDKKRELRKKKHKQSDMAKAGKMPKMGKDKELEEAAEKAKKSSKKVKKIDFFNQLQQKTVQDKQKQSGVAPKRKLDKSETAAKYKG